MNIERQQRQEAAVSVKETVKELKRVKELMIN